MGLDGPAVDGDQAAVLRVEKDRGHLRLMVLRHDDLVKVRVRVQIRLVGAG